MAIERALTDIGLHETEVRFYLAALELGQAPMRDIARKAGISRTNAYDVFSRLLYGARVVRRRARRHGGLASGDGRDRRSGGWPRPAAP